MQKLLILITLIGISACSLDEKDVAGNWQAVSFFENEKSVATNLDSVSLQLSPDGGYAFRSQGFYRESGHYRVSARYLFLTDTTKKPEKEHVVKVIHISQDTLKIRMSNDNKEQVLFLARRE